MHATQARLAFLGMALLLAFSSACSPGQPATPTSAPTVTPSLPPTVESPTRPPPTPTPAVSVTKDVIYATSLLEDGVNWALDVYAPVEVQAGPIVVLLHGLGASKEGYTEASETIAESGAIVYTVTWPIKAPDFAALEDGRRYRDMYETLTCAIHFARATAMDFGADSRQVILVAHSYGSLYGAWMALASDNLDAQWEEYLVDRKAPAARVECARTSDSARVDAFLGIGGGGTYALAEVLHKRDPELWEIVSPFAHMGQRLDLPIRLLHGERDTVTNPESSRKFNDALVEAGHDSRLILFEGRHVVPPQLTAETVLELAGK
jgi:pimeloyl-ACP methyl ester carboxylesterase